MLISRQLPAMEQATWRLSSLEQMQNLKHTGLGNISVGAGNTLKHIRVIPWISKLKHYQCVFKTTTAALDSTKSHP